VNLRRPNPSITPCASLAVTRRLSKVRRLCVSRMAMVIDKRHVHTGGPHGVRRTRDGVEAWIVVRVVYCRNDSQDEGKLPVPFVGFAGFGAGGGDVHGWTVAAVTRYEADQSQFTECFIISFKVENHGFRYE
jgi:hypothetical protein